MSNIGILLVGVLVVIFMVTVTTVIIALAPYIAGGVVVIGLSWYCLRPSKPE